MISVKPASDLLAERKTSIAPPGEFTRAPVARDVSTDNRRWLVEAGRYLHERDLLVPLAQGTYVADRIADAEFVSLDSDIHLIS